MKPFYQIVPARRNHCGPLMRKVREEHARALQSLDQNGHRELVNTLGRSSFARTCLFGGKPVAMWGVTGPVLATTGLVWLVVTEEIHRRFPVTIVRETRLQLYEIMNHYEEVTATIAAGDEAALRFAVFLGFHDRHTTKQRSRKAVTMALRKKPRTKIRIGNGHVIALGYHPNSVN